MKELTIEQKAKAYDEAKLRMSAAYNSNRCTIGFMNEIFPELAESEDEKIRKELIKFVKVNIPDEERYIAWLEKQDEHKKFRDSIQIGDKVTRNQDGMLINLSQLKRIAKPNETKQGEQKPTDKVEPKFHEGEWVMLDRPVLITRVKNMPYNIYEYWTSAGTWFGDATKAKLWTIQDAKDGDVLFTSSTASHETFIFKSIDEKGNVKCYFAYDSEDGFREGKYHFIGKPTFKTHPATKEQRDLLFKKMHEAGYEWDAEKKELKKIEEPENYKRQVMSEITNLVKDYITQKPTVWSKKDDEMLNSIIEEVRYIGNFPDYPTKEENELYDECLAKVNWLKSLKDRVYPQQKWNKEDEERIEQICDDLKCGLDNFRSGKNVKGLHFEEIIKSNINWLKSLRPQSQWKPSEGQLECLGYAIEKAEKDWSPLINNRIYLTLKALREQLLELRKE